MTDIGAFVGNSRRINSAGLLFASGFQDGYCRFG